LLDSCESGELDRLLRDHPKSDDASLDFAAAAIDLALGRGTLEPLPSGLRGRVAAEARRHLPASVASGAQAISPRPSASRRIRSVGWWAAAACFVLAVAGWWPHRIAPPDRLLDRLLVDAKDTVRAPWSVLAEVENVSGDVVWSNDRQEGYLTFEGLPANDPTREQYQLWILDDAQTHPIDGGVFDVPAGAGGSRVIVPIDAKLRVARPNAFAITVEKPGGVVVSTRERLILLAKLD